jgi:hypothetical protein
MRAAIGHIKKMKYIGCIWTRVVVKARTKSANHSIFSKDGSISTILFTFRLSCEYLTWWCGLIVEKESRIEQYPHPKRHHRCGGVLELARAQPF